MKDLTDEEYDALDEYYTDNTIMPDMTRPGFFAHVDIMRGNLRRVKAAAVPVRFLVKICVLRYSFYI